ncbi:MAG: T9SS type A sorting domain-containing protein [Bacteroidetes bacterium]|nr:T9SS type A sorting domain-containing protein [Bacteroidota bacterium]
MKSRLFQFSFLIVFALASLPALLLAQISNGGIPASFSQAIAPDTSARFIVERPSMDLLAKEDQQALLPYRFAVNLPVDFGISTAGQWVTAPDGDKVWRINIKSPDAQGLILYFDRYRLPEGGKVFIYNPKRTQLLGSFTSLNNSNLSTFAAGLIYGDELTIEYNAPNDLPLPELHISEIGHAYRGVSGYTGEKGFGGSGPCEVNINCAEGNTWQNQKRSVARIAVKQGAGSVWCTGSLVNNVRNDGKPYMLTADHCGKYSTEADLNQWIFYFNYESTGCPDPANEPVIKSLTGATMIAHGGNGGNSGSDFFLVLLQSDIPESYHVYFNGWSRETIPPSPSGACIHHPEGDVKKISTYTKPLQPSRWPQDTKLAHWQVTWTETANGHGVTEGGSSGSPLFDSQGRLVGTLTGGKSTCDSLNSPDWYGMFSYSWDQNGTDSAQVLKYWLDPDNTGIMDINGWALSAQESAHEDWVTIFPNPVTDQLSIKCSSADRKELHVTISDIWGNLYHSCDLNPIQDPEMQVNMTGFSPGMYLVRFSDRNRQMVRKIIVQ